MLLNPKLIEMLKDLELVFTKHDVDCYLVGAAARDYWLSAKDDTVSKRGTLDVDIAVLMSNVAQYKQVKQDLFATGNFSPDETEAITVYYKGGMAIDLLPFGEIEGWNRDIRLTDPFFILNMPGFAEVYPYAKRLPAADGMELKVCSVEGIILLKLISNNDRPERSHDIEDIEHMLKVYFELFDDDVYQSHFDLMELYPLEAPDYIPLICAHIVGRKMRMMLSDSPELLARIQGILAKRPTALWQAMLDGINDN